MRGRDREEEMQRSGVATVPESRADVLDYVADYSHDAVDAGLDAEAVAEGLEQAAAEIRERRGD